MQRVLAGIALFAIAVSVGVAPTQARSRLAPADEYFGRSHMSILGIRNELGTIQARGFGNARDARSELGLCFIVEDAIIDFGSKYPHDNWLGPMVNTLEHFYTTTRTRDGYNHARRLAAWSRSISR